MGDMWVSVWQFVQPLLGTVAVVGVVQVAIAWAVTHWIEASLKSRFDKVLEDYKFQLKAHEQAAKIAEYASLAINLKDTDDQKTYNRVNQLAWELFLWLPDDVYRKLGKGLSNNKKELPSAFVDVRKLLLLDKAGTLGADDLISHAPNIGRPKPIQ